ncbi:MAG: CBS domain-containing protein [Nitrospira sp. WS110]|nr:CBS domain-containing protein [Nitrospira sp. WS110]
MPPLHDVMTREVEVLSPNATVAEAAVRTAKLDMGSIPICEGTRLVGMLTDRDLVVRVMAPGCEPKMTRVKQVMTDSIHYCYEDEDSAQALRVMSEQQIRRLPILSRSQQLVGIVSLGDLAKRGEDAATSGIALRRVSS